MITDNNYDDNDDDEDDMYDSALMNFINNVPSVRLEMYLCHHCGLYLLSYKCLQHTGLCFF